MWVQHDFSIQKDRFVQILYDEGRHHWLTVALESNINNEPGVNVYDSMFHSASSHIKNRLLPL